MLDEYRYQANVWKKLAMLDEYQYQANVSN